MTSTLHTAPTTTVSPIAHRSGDRTAAQGFGARIAAPPAAPAPVRERLLESASREVATIQSHEAAIDRLIAGNDTANLSSHDLLRLQATVYAYSERVDVATRAIDKAAGGLRQLLTIQV